MEYQGNILKMRTELATPIRYFLPIGEHEIPMNDLIGKNIQLKHNGVINCISCGKKTKTSFNQGFCYSCYQTAPEASEEVMRPELSKAHLGISRDMEWAEKHDLIDHFVYLAASSVVKVGVTRHLQIPTRWIDQGASSAIKLAQTPNRHIAGIIEVFLKNHYSDKTNWREMLQNKVDGSIALSEEKSKAAALLPAELRQYVSDDDSVTDLVYPVENYPSVVKSLNFEKAPTIEGKLLGIKGQYLIFDQNQVLNIRRHNGYHLSINVTS
ncbi:DUF2797 domain-containing protein [Sunxiuqinia sp. A32]|uniref:DUF2797 domain-containing protein n=1 Tax=Sunxiuqinia sp. A32 TaxID=3461496 RepID=UPI004045AEDC